ncbi:MAG: T9SS type A sorting domain-containing protein, partial [Candidatus Cloacimonetes bacterium]|nr:T9SS type A sorting domain-containing protein [Candidatus Cloacimonadota bacterium]
NPVTNISYSIATNGQVEVSIFNIKGQKVKTLMNDNIEKGTHSVTWNGKDENGNAVSSGLYFYQLKINNKPFSTKKMLLLK